MKQIIESLLIAFIICVCVKTTISDIQKNVISNKIILTSVVIGTLLDFLLYALPAREAFIPFIINLAAISSISILLYALHIWAAGDSKLYFIIGLLFPGSLYWNTTEILSGSWWVALYSVLLGYTYIVVESAFLCAKRKKDLKFLTLKYYFKGYFKRLIVCFAYTTALWVLSVAFWNEFYESHYTLFAFISILIAILASKFQMLKKLYFLIPFIIFDVAMQILLKISVFSFTGITQMIIVVFLLLIENVSEQFDYEVIQVAELKKGMILSTETTLLFMKSRVDGLPPFSTEDLRSRLTDSQVESIEKWSRSKSGQLTVKVVKKIPFAIFLSVGVFIYFLMRFWYI